MKVGVAKYEPQIGGTWADLPCQVDVLEGLACIEQGGGRKGCRVASGGDTPGQEGNCAHCRGFEEEEEQIDLLQFTLRLMSVSGIEFQQVQSKIYFPT